MAALSGRYLGRYHVGEVLGVGGFGAVYLGRDEGLDADVAIKVLADHYSLSPDARERFLSEGRLLRRVDHPGVVTVHDVGETEDLQPYLVLQYAEGGSLAERLDDSGVSVSIADIVEIANQLADAMTAVHDAGIVHRDLAPDNIFISGAGAQDSTGSRLLNLGESLLVGDLGLAKDIIAGSGITSGAGTEGFAAPEQRSPAATVTPAADIYGASALLNFVAHQGGSDEVQRLVASSVSGGLRDDPATRPQTAHEWRDMVHEGMSESPVPVPKSTTRVWWFGAAAAAIALCGVLLLTTQDTTEEPAVTLFDGRELAAGWRNESWGPEDLEVFAPPSRLVQFREFDAVSIITDNPIVFTEDQFLVAEFGSGAIVDRLGLRINNADGDALVTCKADFTDMVRVGDDSIEMVVPGSLLETDGRMSRLAIINTDGSERTFMLNGLYVFDSVRDEPTAESCAPG